MFSLQYFPPTIVLDPATDCLILKEEVFGCVLPIIPYNKLESAISFVKEMEGTPLALYVFTTDDQSWEKVIGEINSGGVVRNDVLVHFACSTMPFGGVGTSGYGKAHGKVRGGDEKSRTSAEKKKKNPIESLSPAPSRA